MQQCLCTKTKRHLLFFIFRIHIRHSLSLPTRFLSRTGLNTIEYLVGKKCKQGNEKCAGRLAYALRTMVYPQRLYTRGFLLAFLLKGWCLLENLSLQHTASGNCVWMKFQIFYDCLCTLRASAMFLYKATLNGCLDFKCTLDCVEDSVCVPKAA